MVVVCICMGLYLSHSVRLSGRMSAQMSVLIAADMSIEQTYYIRNSEQRPQYILQGRL